MWNSETAQHGQTARKGETQSEGPLAGSQVACENMEESDDAYMCNSYWGEAV
jgi:hypothetical protein